MLIQPMKDTAIRLPRQTARKKYGLRNKKKNYMLRV
jgi:hypothetical protein